MDFKLELSYRITSTKLLLLYWMIVQSRIGSWVNFPTYMLKINTLSLRQGEYIASAKGVQLEVYFFKKQKAYR